MGKKRKERTVAELYKRTVKLSKPRITPILEGNCRIQGPLVESDSECGIDTVCNMEDRSLEVNLSEHVEGSVSTTASKRCRNKEQDRKTGLYHNTGDTLLSENKIIGKESLSEHTTGKSTTKDFLEREEMLGSKKTRISSNARRTKGNKSRKAGTGSSNSDYGQKVEIRETSMVEQSEKSLETPDTFQSNDKEKILSLGKHSEESCDKSRKEGIGSSHSDHGQKAEIPATSTNEQSEKSLETPDASQLNDKEKILSLGKQSEETCDKSRKAGMANCHSSMIEQIEKSLETPDASQSNDEEKILSLGKQSEETCNKSRKAGIASSHSDYGQKAEIKETSMIEQIEMLLETPSASQSNDEKIHSLGRQSEETSDNSRKAGIGSSHPDYGQKGEIQATSTIEQSEMSLETTGASQSNDEKILSLGKQSEESCDRSRKAGLASSHSDCGQKAETQATSTIGKSENTLETPCNSQSNDEEKILSLGKQSEETCDKSRKAGIDSSHSDCGQKAEIQATSTIEQSEKSLETSCASKSSDDEKIVSLLKQPKETCNKSRKAGITSSHSDCEQKAELQATGTIERSEKTLGTPGASHSNDEEILSHGKKSGEACDKFSDKEPADILQSNEMPINADTEIYDNDRDIKKKEEADKELPVIKPNDASNINSRESDSVRTTSSKRNLDACNMVPIIVDEINESTGLPGIQEPMPFCYDSDIRVPGSENSEGMPQIHVNGDVCNSNNLMERPVISIFSRLVNTDELTATHTQSLLTANVLSKGTSVSPDMISSENTSTLGLPGRTNSEKATFILTEDSVDVIQKVETECIGRELLPQNINIQTQTPTDNSFPGHSLSINGTEPVNLSVDCGPLHHFFTSSPEKKESSNRFISEGNLSQEAVSSLPLSVTPGHSSITSASQSVTTAREIEAHSSCQQEEDFAFTSVCTESSTSKNTIIIVEEAKDVLVVAARSPEHLQNDCLTRNGLNEDFHVGEARKRGDLSELASPSGVLLPCEETQKSCEHISGEDDVKVCDICGNTGCEEMLAVCSMCNDGAEHTYCMQTMLDEVPESDWLCESCKLKQNVDVKRVGTPPSLTIISKSSCLNSRKQNSYGTARSRLSAKLDKKKLVPERKRALKGIPSSLLSTKRPAEAFEFGPATKKLSIGTSNSNLGSLNSNPKPTFSRENSLKAPDIGKVKTSIAVSSALKLPTSSIHDSGKSSTLYGSSSPRLPINVQLSKNRLFSLSGRMNDSSVVTGTSKAGRNAPSIHTVKMSTDPSPPLRSNSFHNLSGSPKVKESVEVGWQPREDRENTSGSQADGGITKPLKCNMNTDSSTISEPRTTSDFHNLETKETRTGKVTKDGPVLSRKKVMTKSLSIGTDTKPAGATNLEMLAVDDRHAKPVTFPTKDSPNSRPVCSEVKRAVAPTQVATNSNKEHNSLRFSVEGQSQLKTSPSKLQGGATANKLQRSPSTEAFHKVAAEKSEERSLLERTFSVKSMAEETLFSSSIKDDKMSNSIGDKLVAEGCASQYDKKCGTLENKPISNDYPPEENKKTGNFKKLPSLKWSSPNHLTAAGSTRCYKCKELGHSARLCTNRSFAEFGSSSLRVSNLIASAARSFRDTPDTVSSKLSTLEETAHSGNYKAPGNDQSPEQRLRQFNSEQDHVQQLGSGSPRQFSSNKEASYADPKSNSMESCKQTTYSSREFDTKTRESCQVSTPCKDFGRGSTNTVQILTSGLLESSLVNPTCTSSKSVGEKMSHTGLNEKKKSGVDDSKKYSFQKGILEGEASFHPEDGSHSNTAITHHTVFPVEDTLPAIRGNSSYGVPAPSDETDQPGAEFKVVPCRGSSPVETTKATSLPEHNFLWQGGFDVQRNKNCTNYFDGIQAHASTSAASKVLDAAKKFSSKLRLEEVPRYSSWPLQFRHCHPSDKNIALYFFAKDHESYERPYRNLLDHMLNNDLALRGNFDGVELLVFPSNQLAEKSQRWNRLLFLWGVFREKKSTCIESSTCTSENIQGESAKGDTLGSSNLNINDSPGFHHSSSVLGFSVLEEMDTDGDGDRESNASEGTLRVTGNRILPSVSSQDEGPNGNYYDPKIPNSLVVEDKKVYSALKTDKKAAEPLPVKKHSVGSSFESNEQPSSKSQQSNRLTTPDLSAGFETSTAQKLHNARDAIIFEETIPPEAGLAASGKFGEISSSHVFLQTERTKPNNLRPTLSAASAICLSSTERKAYSCDTSMTAHLHSDLQSQQANIDKGKKRPRDIECDRQLKRTKEMESAKLSSKDGEMDQGWRPWEKHREAWSVANEIERDRCISLSREEDYGNCDSKYQRDEMQQRKHPCPSRSHSPPQKGVHSRSSTKQIYNYDFEYSRTHSPELDHIKQSPRCQVPEMIPECVVLLHEKSSNNVAVDGREGRRKLNKSYSDVEDRGNGKEQHTSGTRFAEQKMSSLPSYHIADLNQAADFDFAVELTGTSDQQHIQPGDPKGHLHFPQDSQLTERVFFPYSDDISRNRRLSKLSEQWPIQLGSKQNSSESSSTSRLISSTEENQERLDLNIPNLELVLGGRRASSNPIKSSSAEGTENGSSLALSLAYPLPQNDQTAKTRKEDYKKPANCSVNTSFCLFGHRLNG